MRLLSCVFAVMCVASASMGEQFMLVANHIGGSSVSKYDLDGNYLGDFISQGSGGLSRAVGLLMGADGNVYVASEGSAEVLRYDGQTGAFIDVFADSRLLSGIGYMTFGPGGDLYATGVNNNAVYRIDHQTGEVVSTAGEGGGLSGPDGTVFTPGGEMLVSSYFNHAVKRYDPTSGAYLGDFILGDGLQNPLHLEIAGDELRVVSQGTNSVRRYDLGTGAYLGDLISGGGLFNPIAQIELPNGNRLVSSYSNSSLIEFDANGDLVGVFAAGAADGLSSPTNMLIVPAPGGAFVLAGLGFPLGRRRRAV